MSGTKVSTDPEGRDNPVVEGTGFVASDSLAAEYDSSNASGQGAYGSTASNTDTSGATTLEPARDRQAREGGFEDQSFDDVNDATRGFGKSEGRGPTWNTDDPSTSGGRVESGDSDGSSDPASAVASGIGSGVTVGTGHSYTSAADEGPSGADVDTAPSYVNANELAAEATGRPKGDNLRENEGFDGNETNASFGTDIGGKNDPGRIAVDEFDARNSGAASGTGGPRQVGVDNENPYSTIGDEQA